MLKDTKRQVLFDTLRAAAKGETLLLPEVLARVMNQPTAPETKVAKDAPVSSMITEREREVLLGVARGEHNKEIANRLNITERTVRAHLASIYNKLGVDSRAAAVATAGQLGLLPRESDV